MRSTQVFQVACAAAVLALTGSAAQAGFTYVAQDRSLYAVASDALAPGDPPAGNNAVEDRDSASGFGRFEGEVYAEYFDAPVDLQTARGTQTSELREDGIFANGLLRVTAGDERAIARTRVHVDFAVDEARQFALELSLDYETLGTTGIETEPGGVRLTRLVNGSEGDVLVERTVNKPEDLILGLGEDEPFEFARTGTLAPGQYRFEFDYSAANLASGGRDILEYDLSLRDVGRIDNGGGEPNPIPLPPAAWAGLSVMAAMGAGNILRARRAARA